jgi:hypothetical protein
MRQYKYLSEHAIKFVGSTLALTFKCENAYYKRDILPRSSETDRAWASQNRSWDFLLHRGS